MPYILAVEAQSIANRQMDTGDWIEVTQGNAKKTVKVEVVSRGRATVYWPLAGQYDVDLQSGELMSQVMPLNGIYRVDYLTGRVEGTRCSVPHDVLQRIDTLRPGDKLRLVHSTNVVVQAEVVDSLPSEGSLSIYVRTPREAMHVVGRPYGTGWRVTEPVLAELRARAGVSIVARAS